MRIGIIGYDHDNAYTDVNEWLQDNICEGIAGDIIVLTDEGEFSKYVRNCLSGKVVPVYPVKTDYVMHGNAAPLKRDTEFVKHIDKLVVFWDFKAPGIARTITVARMSGIPILVNPLEETGIRWPRSVAQPAEATDSKPVQ